jgi:hypothetical protein
MGQDRWANWAPTDPQEDRLKDGERALHKRQKRTDKDKQEDRVLKEKKKKKIIDIFHCWGNSSLFQIE